MERIVCEPLAAVNVGTFERFADAWVACLRQVMDKGTAARDQDLTLRESLNVSLSARTCDIEALIAAGASEARIRLMTRKYTSLSVLPEYDMSYGSLFRSHHGIDQVNWLIKRLAQNPDSKSATIGFHIPGNDRLSCISLVNCKLRDKLLHFNAVFRSQNIYASQPGNAYALSNLQDEIAERLDVSVGYLTLHVISAHVYETDWDAANDIISNSATGSTR